MASGNSEVPKTSKNIVTVESLHVGRLLQVTANCSRMLKSRLQSQQCAEVKYECISRGLPENLDETSTMNNLETAFAFCWGIADVPVWSFFGMTKSLAPLRAPGPNILAVSKGTNKGR